MARSYTSPRESQCNIQINRHRASAQGNGQRAVQPPADSAGGTGQFGGPVGPARVWALPLLLGGLTAFEPHSTGGLWAVWGEI